MSQQPKIPRIAHAFFKWYCKRDRYEEMHGDLEEFFYERIEESGLRKAKRKYWLDVVKCCQPYAWKKPGFYTNSNIIMFKNYFKTSLRSSLRNPLSTFINVFGLSMAIGVCMAAYAFVKGDHDIDRFHKNKDEVFLSTFYADRDGEQTQYGMSPAPLGKSLQQDFAAVEKMCRIKYNQAVIKFGDNVFNQMISFTDADFLEMFNFPLKWGDPGSLKDPNSIILSQEMAVKYFGEQNPLGREMIVKFGENNRKIFKVTGVAEPFPDAHIIEFSFLVNFENLKLSAPDWDVNDWSNFVNATFVQVNEASAIPLIAERMRPYKDSQNAVQTDWRIDAFDFHQLTNLHFASANIRNGISYDYTSPGRITLPIVAVLLIILACLNYINMAIASATKRLKEIGVRKVIGASRGKVIFQFLAENMLLTFFALVMGLALGRLLFIPGMHQIADVPLHLKADDVYLWGVLVAILLITGLLSGAYPAFYISKFQASSIFKGNLRFGRTSFLTRAFLAFELILACVAITSAVVFSQNTTYQMNRPWGYDQANTLYANVSDRAGFDQLRAVMQQDPNISLLSGSEQHIGKGILTAIINLPDRKFEVEQLKIGANYFETLGVEIVEGRDFSIETNSDGQAAIINETMVRNLGMEQPIGQVLTIDSVRYQVVGVAKDYHAFNFERRIRPTVFRKTEEANFHYLSLQARPGKAIEVYDNLKAQWTELFPEEPFSGGFQEDTWGPYFEEIANYAKFSNTVAVITMSLAALGLFGLITLNVSGRVREFSIRKALGARVKNITLQISRQYALLVTIALAIGVPLSFVAVREQLAMVFVYPIPMHYGRVSIAALILLGVLVLVISTQVRKVSRSNPVNGLRSE